MNDNAGATADRDALLDHFAAELTCVAYHIALRHGAVGAWLDLELDLWRALADTVKGWGRRSPPPAEGSGGGGDHHTHHAHMVADFQRSQ